MLLKDKVVMITGVGPGMGSKLAINAAREGAKVSMCARSEGFLNDVLGMIEADGGTAIAVPTDISDADQCKNFIEKTTGVFGRIDGLVNSAYRHGDWMPLETANLDDMRETMNVNLFGHLQLIQGVIPAMKEQGGGAIVNVNTMSAKKPFPGEGAYTTSKAALAGATKVLAKELGPYNIRVNSAFMGWLGGVPVETYIKGAAQEQGVSEDVIIAGVTQNIPLGIIPPDEDCANSVLFFVSDYSKVVTGASLDINGGEYMSG